MPLAPSRLSRPAHPRLLAAALAAGGLALAPRAAHAQLPATSVHGTTIAVVAGASQYDLSGTGTAPHLAVRVIRSLFSVLLFEAGTGVTRYRDQGGERVWLILPEAQFQVQGTFGRVAPYLGLGGGLAGVVMNDAGDVSMTASASGGARLALSSDVSAGAELRVRGIGAGFTGATAEWTLGLVWRP